MSTYFYLQSMKIVFNFTFSFFFLLYVDGSMQITIATVYCTLLMIKYDDCENIERIKTIVNAPVLDVCTTITTTNTTNTPHILTVKHIQSKWVCFVYCNAQQWLLCENYIYLFICTWLHKTWKVIVFLSVFFSEKLPATQSQTGKNIGVRRYV